LIHSTFNYQRPFRQPLITSHGVWEIREGIVLQLTDSMGRSQLGEIAPIPWFGSESIERAREWCAQFGDNITTAQIESIPDSLPACQFGFGSALRALQMPPVRMDGWRSRSVGKASTFADGESKLNLSALLPSGEAAIARLLALSAQGYSTFKWKIGVLPIEREIAIWQQLMTVLPADTQLRLDANGGLTYSQAQQWLEICDRDSRIEFIEQPLAPDRVAETIELATIYTTPIALDESVATLDRIQTVYAQGWRGIYVIKPGIAGFPWRLAALITQHQLDVVFSSVMETRIGRTAALQLASSLKLERSMGFGVEEWFDDDV
jgi:o-succinylbenzoate synthase